MTGASINRNKLICIIDCVKLQPHLFFLIRPQLEPFCLLFGPFGAICEVGIGSKIFFRTYLCRQSTLVLEVQLYLFVFNLVSFGTSFALFFSPLGLSFFVHWGPRIMSKSNDRIEGNIENESCSTK